MIEDLSCPKCGWAWREDVTFLRPNPAMPAFAMPRCPMCGAVFRLNRGSVAS